MVSLMTLHTAKGLEFRVVFLTGMEEGLFPHNQTLSEPEELEEERRLCYVGITRAREELYLTNTWNRTLFGSYQASLPSRFMKEIPDELCTDVGEGLVLGQGRGWGMGREYAVGGGSYAERYAALGRRAVADRRDHRARRVRPAGRAERVRRGASPAVLAGRATPAIAGARRPVRRLSALSRGT